jgi:nifR3 family TIM-barrel protein
MNFWQKLKKPIIVLAPMADVTDAPFRRLFAKYGKPDVTWTEFVSADGLIMAPDNNFDDTGLSSKQKLLKDLEYTEEERPIVAQLFSGRPEMMKKAAELVAGLGFDGIDINMGCPDRSVEKQKSGASLIKNPELAKALVQAAKEGAPNIPVSVKTRIGYNKLEEMESWVSEILSTKPATLTLHWRTRKEMSKVPAHWELAKKAVELRDKISPETILLGNGDIDSLEKANQIVKETGVDGVMVGRGIFGNPWFFNPDIIRDRDISVEEKLKVLVEHTKLFCEILHHKNFSIMKKHYKAYVEGFDGAKELRIKLMEAKDSNEVENIVADYLKNL